MISAICFDFDGTIVDSNQIKKEMMLSAVNDLPGGERVMTGLMTQFPPLDRFGIFDAIADRYSLNKQDLEQRLARFNQNIHDAITAAPFMPGAQQALDDLVQRGIPLFLNSATPETQLQAIVHDRGMTGLFQGVLGRPTSKEDNILKVVKQTGIPMEQILMIGDGADDQDSATDTGCQFQAVFDFRGTVRQDMTVLTDMRDLLSRL